MAGILDKVLTGAASLRQAATPAGSPGAEKINRRDVPGGKHKAWTCGVVYETTSSTSILERWLEENTTGDWTLVLDNIDDAREAKTVKIFFVNQRDKAAFVAQFGRA